MIELKHVTKQYGKSTVLHQIDLTIDEPGIYCLLGRNGAGKTTLLKSIAGYQNVTSGQISVGGRAISTASTGYWRQLCGKLCKAFQLACLETAADGVASQCRI